ncbi:ComF family protein [Silvibacterium sp.]|uniref:ComF family protein n=1 Tax=Silvibacterium sp. TaxID=1964179 RepID=UPI0039E6B32F
MCELAPPHFTRAVACGPYDGAMRPLLHLLKYDGLEPVAGQISALLAARLSAESDLPAQMSVVPVPLHRARRRERGFNQAELLARGVVRAMRGLRPEWKGALNARALRRVRATQSLAGLSLSERRRVLRGAFFVAEPEAIAGRDVLLVDDIFTTGATVRACAFALKRAGAATVWVATAARAQKAEATARFEMPQEEAAQEEFREPTADEMRQDAVVWRGTVH